MKHKDTPWERILREISESGREVLVCRKATLLDRVPREMADRVERT